MTQGTFNFQWDKATRNDRLKTMRRIVETNAGLTTRMIANRMGLKKTPYIRAMLINLMEDGSIHYDWQEMTNGARVMVWFAGPTPIFEDQERDLESELEEQAEDHYNETGVDSEGYSLIVAPEKFPEQESGFPYVTIDGEIDDLPF